MSARPARPIGITLLALPFLWIGCIGALVFPIIIFTGVIYKGWEALTSTYIQSRTLSLLGACVFTALWFGGYVLYACIGVGLWRLSRWAWKAVVAVQLISLAGFLLIAVTMSVEFGSALIGLSCAAFSLPLCVAILWYLNRPNTRQAFGIGPAGRWMSLFETPRFLLQSKLWVKITLVVMAASAALAIFVCGLFATIETSFRSSPVYASALSIAQNSPCVTNQLGSPIVAKGMTSGSMSTSANEGSAELSIPIQSSKGKADLELEAEKADGAWVIKSLILDQDGAQTDLVSKGMPSPCH